LCTEFAERFGDPSSLYLKTSIRSRQAYFENILEIIYLNLPTHFFLQDYTQRFDIL
jgi:hypothetical protein